MNIPSTISLAQVLPAFFEPKKYLKSAVTKLTACCWLGASGAGKSSVIRQVAEDLEIGFIDVRASQLEPVDAFAAYRLSRTGN